MTSPTRKESVEVEHKPTIDLEEERAAAAVSGLNFDDDDDDNDINVETLGMTAARQKEIEGSLFKMLGQNEAPAKVASDQASHPNNMTSTEDAESSDEDEILVSSSRE